MTSSWEPAEPMGPVAQHLSFAELLKNQFLRTHQCHSAEAIELMGLALYSHESPDTFDSVFLFFQDDTKAKSLWSHCLSNFHVWGWHTESHLSGICLLSGKWAKRHRLDPGATERRRRLHVLHCLLHQIVCFASIHCQTQPSSDELDNYITQWPEMERCCCL